MARPLKRLPLPPPIRVFTLLDTHDRALAAGDSILAATSARELAEIALGDKSFVATRRRLVIGPAAAWFRWDDAELVELRRRRASRLVLEVLHEHRVASPGAVVPATTLIAAGWPGESIRATSAMSRLYVAVLALRNLGLRDAILGQDGGYLLDPEVSVGGPYENKESLFRLTSG